MVIQKYNLRHSHLSSLLQHYTFLVRYLLVCYVELLGLEFMQQFTNLLTWVDCASVHHSIILSWLVCGTGFQVNINVLDLLPSISRVFY